MRGATHPPANTPPRLQDIRGVQMWGGDLVALARERPSLRIRADTEDDHWDPEIAGWQQ